MFRISHTQHWVLLGSKRLCVEFSWIIWYFRIVRSLQTLVKLENGDKRQVWKLPLRRPEQPVRGRWDPSSSQVRTQLHKVGTSKFKPWCTRRLGHLPRFGKSGGLRPSTCSYIVISYTNLVEKPKELTSKNVVVRFAEQNCLKIFGHCGFISDSRPNKRHRITAPRILQAR